MIDSKKIIKEAGIDPNKALGQNFLTDEEALNGILELALPDGKNVLEIGPGLGALTDRLAETAMKLSQFHLAITPEGTRKPNPDWKKGFYYIALKAGIPIVLAGIDYQKKEIRIEKEITPSGNIDADMKEIKRYFKDFKGKHPENFTVGEID